jgi:hypothetical protein
VETTRPLPKGFDHGALCVDTVEPFRQHVLRTPESEMKRIVIVWRDEHAGEQFDRQFGTDWADVLREIHAKRECDCCAPMAFAPNGAKAWINEGELVLGNNWKE